MNDWEKPNETSLSKKEGLRSLRYGRSYIFMLTYVFGNYRNMSYIYVFRNMCYIYIYIYIYTHKLFAAEFLSAPGLAWQAT